MATVKRATFPHAVAVLLLFSLAGARPTLADEFTGEDSKELLPPPAQQTPVVYDSGFLPMPSWARGAVMPPLPQTLKPMGKKVVVLTTPPVPAPGSLTPPVEPAAPTVTVARPAPVAPAPAQTPAMIAVSPFLDWIKANPQAATEQARQQASAYAAGTEPNAPAPTTTVTAPNNNGSVPVAGASAPVAPAPYWLPPLIDSAPFGTSSGGSSAAIYSTPQR